MSNKKNKRKKTGWKAPKDAAQYFDRHYNDGLKKRHKVQYGVIVAIDLLIVVVPTCGYCILAGLLANENANEVLAGIFGMLGYIGSVGVALGIANIWMSALHQYLGHWFTLITLGGGSLLSAFGLWMISGAY